MNKLTAVLAAIGLLATTVQASAAQCYTQRQFEAEQGIRIHSELMVIALTCMKMPLGAGMFEKYQSFTEKNKALLAGYETDMIGYYRDSGVASPEKQFHTLRTNLANEISQHAIKMSTGSFCQHFASRLDSALKMDEPTLRQWASHPWPNTPASRPLCDKVAKR